jgi:hypothetical protein
VFLSYTWIDLRRNKSRTRFLIFQLPLIWKYLTIFAGNAKAGWFNASWMYFSNFSCFLQSPSKFFFLSLRQFRFWNFNIGQNYKKQLDPFLKKTSRFSPFNGPVIQSIYPSDIFVLERTWSCNACTIASLFINWEASS